MTRFLSLSLAGCGRFYADESRKERHRFHIKALHAARALFLTPFLRARRLHARSLFWFDAELYHPILLRPFLRSLVPTFCAGRRGPCLRSPKIHPRPERGNFRDARHGVRHRKGDQSMYKSEHFGSEKTTCRAPRCAQWHANCMGEMLLWG